MMVAYQNAPAESTVLLKLGASPVTGVLYTDITVQFKKFAQTSLVTKTMTALNWTEIGNGYYTLSWLSSDLDTVGNFFFQVSGLLFDLFVDTFSIEVLPAQLVTVPPNVCLISGTVFDIAGQPLRNVKVRARPVFFPMGDSNGNLIAADVAQAITDHTGFFQIELAQGKLVIIEIERTAIRNQITVPNASTALLSNLLPAPPN